jgi:uncharacterized protein YndB with AHSA1/START domain
MPDQLRVAAEAATSAHPEDVWSLISDANSFPTWGPWAAGGYRPAGPGPSQPGSTQWFRYGRRTVSVEEVLEVEPPRRLVYTVVKGLPVKHYRAEVILTPTVDGGTRIHWSARWDRTILGRIVHRKLQQLYPEIVTALAAASDRRALASSD